MIVYDSDTAYREEVCEICRRPLAEAPTMVTYHYPEERSLPFHAACYKAISDPKSPPRTLTPPS